MINEMQQVVIVGRRRDNKAIITALQDAGVLHIVPIVGGPLTTGALTGVDADTRKRAERLLARAESTLSELGTHRAETATLPAEDRWEEVIERVATPSAEITARLNELRGDLEAESTYGEVVRALADLAGGLDKSRRVNVVPFILPKGEGLTALTEALEADFKGRYALETRNVNTGQGGTVTAGLVAVLAADRDRVRAALAKARTGELRLPGRFDSLPLSTAAAEFDRLRKEGRTEVTRLEDQRRELAEQHGPELYAVRDALADQVSVFDVQTLGARGRYSLALQGFVPTDRAADLRRTLDAFGDAVSYELHAVDEHHAEIVPVQLKNNAFVRPFELLLNISAPPRYGSFDPSWIVAVFFPFYFGYVIADIAFGLLLLWAGLWLVGKSKRGEGLNLGFMGTYLDPRTVGFVGFIVNVMSFWAIVWGFLTGEFFGTLAEHWHIFYIPGYHEGGLIPIVWPRLQTEFAGTALVFALAFGILQVLWGWGLRAQLALKHGDKNHFWEAIGIFGGLVGLVLLAYTSDVGSNLGGAFSDFTNPLTIVMLAGFLVFLLGVIISKVWLMFIELLSQGGAIVSFARLFAVGLAAGILATLATEVGWGMYKSMGVMGAILGTIVAAIIHFFAIALTIIGHVLQPLRLQYVEFLNPTGFYNESGPRYNPFRRLSPAVSKK